MMNNIVKTLCLLIVTFPAFADSIRIDNLVLKGATVLDAGEIKALS
jgi:hypothetical protein